MEIDNPRCYEHRTRPTFPAACVTCQRISVEHDIVTRVVNALHTAGYSLQTDQAGDGFEPAVPTADRVVILGHLMETHDERLYARKDGKRAGWVYFVYGNDGYDVISDYTTNLENVLAPINAYADTLG